MGLREPRSHRALGAKLATPGEPFFKMLPANLPLICPMEFATLRLTPIGFTIPRPLFAGALTCQCFLDPLLLTWFQVESVPLDVLNDVLLEDLSLEALERALQTFAIVKLNFSQRNSPRFPIRFYYPSVAFPRGNPRRTGALRNPLRGSGAWWAVAGSNRGPPACKAGALTG